MKKLIKTTLLATLVTLSFTVQANANQFENWHCITEDNDLIAMYVTGDNIFGHIAENGSDLVLMGTQYEGDVVRRGEDFYMKGSSTYLRFTYTQSGKQFDWVIMSGEVPFHSFQGARLFLDGKYERELKCYNFVETQIGTHHKVLEDDPELFEKYGTITRDK